MTIARVTEIIAGSTASFDEAIRSGIERAQKTLDNVEGAWVKDMKIVCEDGRIVEYRVGLMVTFVLKD